MEHSAFWLRKVYNICNRLNQKCASCRLLSPSRLLNRLILPTMFMVITPITPLLKKAAEQVKHLAHFYFGNALKNGSSYGRR